MTTERRKNRRQHRRRKSVIAYGAAGVVLAASVTYGTIALASPDSSDAKADAAADAGTPHALQDDFTSAAREFGVPQSVLMAVSYRQTLWESHDGQPSTTGNYNVMGLTQVNPADVSDRTASEAAGELNQSGDPVKEKHFHPSAKALRTAGAVDTADPRLHTLDAAAKLIGSSPDALRTDERESVRGAAALLKSYEQKAVGSLPTDPGRWYAAVERYSQSPDIQGAELFANRVFDTVRTGASRTTADGQQVTLPASPHVTPATRERAPLAAAPAASPASFTGTDGPRVAQQADYVVPATGGNATTTAVPADTTTATTPTPECPTSLNCNFVWAAFKQNSTDKADYGNFDATNRPDGTNGAGDGTTINSIVIHDTESSYSSAVTSFRTSTTYASAHYVIRASDGLVTQMVPIKDTAWHAGNKTLNMHSIGIEHEGYAIKSGTWYTEPQYESSAQLVRYLTARLGIPRDREHIFGHDEVPGPLDHYVAGMHWDPGPYWDWNHYMQLVTAPTGAGGAGAPLRSGQVVRVVPPYTTANEPTITYGGTTQAAHPANFGYLYTSPSTSSARLADPYLHSGTAGTTEGPDWSDKVVAGGRYVVAGTSGYNWTAIWYGGKKAWFYNPGGQYTAVVSPTASTVVTPAAGKTSIPVYGRAYPEAAAYSGTQVPVQDNTYGKNSDPLFSYSIAAGQSYVAAGPAVHGAYFYAENYDNSAPGDHTLVTGSMMFYPIRYNHRMAWVNAADVTTVTPAGPISGATRSDLMGRDSSGVLWQYQGTSNGSTPFLGRYKIGSGWQVYNAITRLTPLHADGTGDAVARDTSGVLWYYQGSGNINQPFKARTKVGAGWSIYTLLAGVGDLTGDGRADLVARDSKGVLWLYKGTGSTTAPFATRVQIGAGWNTFNALVGTGDITGDGKPDLVARSTGGYLYLYKGTGSTTAPLAARTTIGSGWSIYNAMVGVGDITGDGRPDLVARDTKGALWEYKGTGSATAPFAARVQVGTGWNMYGLVF